jgi:hypothetical protein
LPYIILEHLPAAVNIFERYIGGLQQERCDRRRQDVRHALGGDTEWRWQRRMSFLTRAANQINCSSLGLVHSELGVLEALQRQAWWWKKEAAPIIVL